MKITYLKLRNFIGIYNGLGVKEVEFDLSKGLNPITLLVGKNGSGKSSVLSTLHPFAGTFDDKSSFILPNKQGFKEIHIDNNGTLYKIQHYYDYTKKSKSTKSFIQRVEDDGSETELNENGGVRTFEEVIKNELDLVPSFLTLSRIGSNVSNFIDKKSTDRKKQITEFLPDIEDFLYNYKIINDKWSACKKDIKTVTDQINRIDSSEHLDTLEVNEINMVNQLNELIQNERKLQTEYNYRINQLDPDGSIRNKYVELGTEYNDLTGRTRTLREIDYGKYKSLDIVETSLNSLSNKRIIRTERLSELEKQNVKITSKLLSLESSLNDLENKYETSSGGKVLSEYYEMRDEYKNKIEEHEDSLSKFPKEFKRYDKFSNDDIAGYDEEFIKLEEAVKDLLPSIDLSVLESIDSEKVNELANKTIPQLTNMSTKTRDAVFRLTNEANSLLGNLHQKDILDQRPTSCSNDECPFIKEALKFINVEIQLEKIQKRLETAKDKLSKQEEALKLSNEIYSTYLRANSIYTLMKDSKVLPKIHYYDMTINEFIDKILKGDLSKYKDITEIRDYIFVKNDLGMYKELLKETENEIKILEEKQILLDSITEQINRTKKDIEEENEELESNNNEQAELKDTLNKLDKLEVVLNEAHEHYIELESNESRIEELKAELKTISDTINEIKQLNASNKEVLLNIQDYENELEPHIKTLDKIKIDKANLETFNEKKKSLDKVYNDLNIIRDALNPNKGIPLLFINTYLTKTKLIANNLLDVAFKGKFRIEEFEVTDKDFFIKLQKADGELLPDVIYASQGERALISLSISMALIQQSMSKYNILLLDEIDAELDGSNRKSFIEILENQFEMLGVEQCFLITHNNEFDSYNTNLMLFKDHDVDTHNEDYMTNKIIIFEAGMK